MAPRSSAQHSLSTRTQDPTLPLGGLDTLRDGRGVRYIRAISNITEGQLVAVRIYATISSGITAAAGTATFTSSGSSFTPRVTDATGRVTTWESPARGSILHVAGGTGKQQLARVTDVLSATKLGVEVVTGTVKTWTTALAATDTVCIIEPVGAPYDSDTHTLPPAGVAYLDIDAAEFAFIGTKGRFWANVNSTVVGTPLCTGPTAGQLEPEVMWGSATWNASSIANGAEEVKEVTVTGAELGDLAQASLSIDVADLTLTAQVTAADTVTAQLSNNTGGAIDLASGTLRVKVTKDQTMRYHVGTLISPPATAGEKGLVDIDLPPWFTGEWTW